MEQIKLTQAEIDQQSIQDVIRKEYAKCAQDPVYFMKKYCTIRHPKRGLLKFDLYDFQEDAVGDFLKYK